MLPQDFVHYDKTFTNQNIISRHLKEVQALSSNPTNLETEYSKLRHKHTAESNTLHYYKKVYEKNKTNKTDTLNGYYKLCNTNIHCNEMFEGSIFVLSAENQLNTICIKRFEDLEYFYEFLRYAPQPFIFLPFGDIYECRKLTKEMNLMSNNKSGIYVAEDEKQIVMVVEPFVLVRLDLEYLIEEFVNDQNICYFLYGFIVNKSDI